MDHSITVTLPRGWWHRGTCYQEAQLRPLTGSDLSFLGEVGETFSPAQRTTALISRGLTRLGPFESITTEQVQRLTVGDCEALLLHLHSLTFGERMQCVLACPSRNCGEKIELELQASDLLLPDYPAPQSTHQLALREDEKVYCITARVPNIGDLETVTPLARSDLHAATTLLVSRCVEEITVAESDGPVACLPEALIEQLSTAFAELDPQSEITLNLTCPNCEHNFTALLDTTTFLYEKLKSHVNTLYQETHLLAFHYHWSEAEIMNMGVNKRRRYLELLEEELSQRSHV
jgi:hypothetical protein